VVGVPVETGLEAFHSILVLPLHDQHAAHMKVEQGLGLVTGQGVHVLEEGLAQRGLFILCLLSCSSFLCKVWEVQSQANTMATHYSFTNYCLKYPVREIGK